MNMIVDEMREGIINYLHNPNIEPILDTYIKNNPEFGNLKDMISTIISSPIFDDIYKIIKPINYQIVNEMEQNIPGCSNNVTDILTDKIALFVDQIKMDPNLEQSITDIIKNFHNNNDDHTLDKIDQDQNI